MGRDGKPIANAKIAVEYKHTPIQMWINKDKDNEGRVLGCSTAGDGTFELYGVIDKETSIRLVAYKQGYLCLKPVVLLERRRDAIAVVLLDIAAQLRGVVLTDASIPRSALKVQYRPAVGGRWIGLHLTEKEGMFQVDCMPGFYDLSVCIRRTGEVARSVRGILAPAQELEIDLRGRLFSFLVTVVDRDGRLLGGTRVLADTKTYLEYGRIDSVYNGGIVIDPFLAQSFGSCSWGWNLTVEAELRANRWRKIGLHYPVRVLSTKPAVDLRICAPGKKTRKIKQARTDQQLELEDGPEVQVIVHPSSAVPAGYSIRGYHHSPKEVYPPRFVFNESGQASFRVSDTKYKMGLTLALVRDDGKKGMILKCQIRTGNRPGTVIAELQETIEEAMKRMK